MAKFLKLAPSPVYRSDAGSGVRIAAGAMQAHKTSHRASALSVPTTALFFLLFAFFYVANTYTSKIAAPFLLIKWIPLLIFFFLGLMDLNSRRIRFPVVPLSLLLLASCAASTFITPIGASITFVFGSLVLLIITAPLMAIRIREPAAQAAFFDIVANVGRLVVLSNAVLYYLGINLGRVSYRFSGWLDNPNTLGLLLAPITAIFFARLLERRRNWQILDALFLVISLYLLLMTESRAAIGWAAISILGLYFLKRGPGFVTIGALVVALAALFFWDTLATTIESIVAREQVGARLAPVLSGRLDAWAFGRELIVRRPFLGFGVGASQHLFDAEFWRFAQDQIAGIVEHEGKHFHSSYITAAVESGLIGLGLLLLTILAALTKGYRDVRIAVAMRARNWPTIALPVTIILGALFHGGFESWFLSAGNAQAPLLWICIMLLFVRTHLAPPSSMPPPARRLIGEYNFRRSPAQRRMQNREQPLPQPRSHKGWQHSRTLQSLFRRPRLIGHLEARCTRR